MSCELYIGNFPSSLTSEDLIVLFEDFDGIELLRLIKKEKKCFAFFRCVDQDQAAHVVMTMNGIDVCGRNLIVRSSDDKLQAKIERNPQSINQIEKQFSDLNLGHPSDTKNVAPEYAYHDGYSALQNNGRKPNPNTRPYGRGAKARQNTFAGNPEKGYGDHDYSIGFYDEKLEKADSTSSHPSYGCSRDLEVCDQNEYEVDAEISKDELFFVSVVNFPLGSSNRDLYELFSDYNPFKIFMVCNCPRVDKQPTEAIVSFINRSDATDAIINLDNTVYRKRVLLVTDAADTSIVPELLSLS